MRWYLVYTKPLSESVAQLNLERQGFEVYCPRLQGRAAPARTGFPAGTALFPRYLFVGLREDLQALAPVRSTFGVARVVRFGPDYALVPAATLAELKRRADPRTGLHVLAPRQHVFAGGEPVRIAATADNLDAIFEREDGRQRAVVLLRLLGREVPVRVPLCRLAHEAGGRPYGR